MGSIVMGWDPGGTTGVCAAELDSTAPGGFRVLEDTVVLWPNRFSRIRDLLERYRPRTTIVESFTLYRHKAQDQIGSNFPSSQVIGIIEAYCYMAGIAMPIYQPAHCVAGKPPVQILPEHQPMIHHSEHGKDAYKHVRYWVVQQKQPTPVPPRRGR